jgi:ABC-type nitrate/sulfonate/bicarbonate transport system permease component
MSEAQAGPLAAALAGMLVLVVIWTAAALVVGNARTLPTPAAVATQTWHDLGLYGLNLPPTLEGAGFGLVLGDAAAIGLGFLLAMLPVGRRELMAVVVTLYNLPVIAIGPLVEVLLSGDWPKIVMAALSVFFVTLVGVLAGFAAADARLLDVAKATGAGRLTAILKVRLWSAGPSIAAGIAAGVPFAIVGAMVGEFFGGQSFGLGVMLVQALDNLNAARVWSIALCVALLGGVGMAAVRAAGRVLMPWGESAMAASPAGLSVAAGGMRRGWLLTLRTLISAVITILLLLGFWVGSIKVLGLQPFLARSPADIWHYLVTDPNAAASRGQLLRALASTFWLAIGGCAIGVAVGSLIAVAITTSRLLGGVIMPAVVVLSSIPYLALVPILAVALGRSTLMNLTLAALIALLPTVVNVRAGLQSARSDLRDLLRAAGASRWALLRHVYFPTAVPSLFTSLRIAAPWSLLGVILGEWLATGGGIGGAMVDQAVIGDYNAAWSSATAVTVGSVALYIAVGSAERFVLRRYGSGAGI